MAKGVAPPRHFTATCQMDSECDVKWSQLRHRTARTPGWRCGGGTVPWATHGGAGWLS